MEQKEKDVIFKCYSVGGPVSAASAQFINAKNIIAIVPTKFKRETRIMIVYYDHELRSECSFFCDSITIESNEK